MGDKSAAKETMRKAGVPTVPGSDGLVDNLQEALDIANAIGYPLIIKATAAVAAVFASCAMNRRCGKRLMRRGARQRLRLVTVVSTLRNTSSECGM
ncbi:hypothetical protein GCM10025858_03550 [Alicyclobacillus sacchari]|nr:hypothetical protein GCM10025858_03550 [Alicyclobacillus sacchari]